MLDFTRRRRSPELIGDACEQNGSYAEAVAHWTRAAISSGEAMPSTSAVPGMSKHEFTTALRALWRPRLNRLMQRIAQEEYVPAMEVARAHARLGHTEETLAWLTRASPDRDRLILELPLDPQFHRFRGEPRFDALVASLPNGRLWPAGKT